MRQQVIVRIADDEFVLAVPDPMAPEAARAWLDDEFVRLGCEPARASGKVLFADKLLAIVQAAGTRGLDDIAWSASFARAAAGALGRPLVRIDVGESTVGF